MNCTALEKWEKLRYLTLRVLLLQKKATKLGIIFWDTQYMNILSKFKYRFYCIKRQRKSKIHAWNLACTISAPEGGVLEKISTGVLVLLFWFEIWQIVIFWVCPKWEVFWGGGWKNKHYIFGLTGNLHYSGGGGCWKINSGQNEFLEID